MDFDLPLILFVLVVVSGILTLYDFLFLAKKRKQAIATVDHQFEHLNTSQKESSEGYQQAYQSVASEPSYIETAKSFFPLLLVVFVVRSFLIEPFQIPSESMVPTLEVGDFLAVNKFAYGIRLPVLDKKIINVSDPKRGDVMVFIPPNDPRYYIKRVIGLPGDKIVLEDNKLYINDEAVKTTFIKTIVPTQPTDNCYRLGGVYHVEEETLDAKTYTTHKCSVPGPLGNYRGVVPTGHYFMMGDNRDNSADSRDWGMEPDEKVVGKAFVIWMHWEKFFSLPSFSRVGKL